MTLRECIKDLCKTNGISLNKLEQECGLGKGYVSKLDKNSPNLAKIQKIADYFNVSLNYLMNREEPELEENKYISPARQALLESLDGLSESQIEKIIEVIKPLRKML